MRRHNLNMARRPFVNQRPVVRISGLLWGLGLALLLLNVWLYWSFYRNQEQTRSDLTALEASMDREQSRIQDLESRLASIDLEAQNAQVEFLNQRIERRTFGWSVLFDTLAEVLPRDVRLTHLRPGGRLPASSRELGGQSPDTPQVLLSITGQAKSPEDLYGFLDALIASPAFRAVNPKSEAQDQGGVVSFNLTTIYLPEQAAARQGAGPESEDGATPREDDGESGDGQGDEGSGGAESIQQARALPGGAS